MGRCDKCKKLFVRAQHSPWQALNSSWLLLLCDFQMFIKSTVILSLFPFLKLDKICIATISYARQVSEVAALPLFSSPEN